ncbi:hypothetical protein AG1IA_00668 [Rhizoctonia solani AG-1 IA]|uniref:Uncharacterized protein n=1 Tax=Thanatephorus cucumeris (strain AG1-IA) TaxID=983506 RepID=L8X896_THACA|nr:hypothetical protein AG1IA_00668 [Rhizoctonia solani AG-1 IA]
MMMNPLPSPSRPPLHPRASMVSLLASPTSRTTTTAVDISALGRLAWRNASSVPLASKSPIRHVHLDSYRSFCNRALYDPNGCCRAPFFLNAVHTLVFMSLGIRAICLQMNETRSTQIRLYMYAQTAPIAYKCKRNETRHKQTNSDYPVAIHYEKSLQFSWTGSRFISIAEKGAGLVVDSVCPMGMREKGLAPGDAR